MSICSHISEGECCSVCNSECEQACPLIKCTFGSHVPEGDCCPVCNEDPWVERCPVCNKDPYGECCPVCNGILCKLTVREKVECSYGSEAPQGKCCPFCSQPCENNLPLS
eukprot:Awhi_evm1s15406